MKSKEDGPHLHLTLEPALLPSFFPLLQGGVSLDTRTGLSVKEFLTEELRLSQEYMDTVIQTVFLDGKAVDDLASANIRDGAIMALSAAMPGLLGATLRRGSYYAAMRKEISYRESPKAAGEGPAKLTLKVFNLLLRDLGPALLAKGFWIGGDVLEDFFGKRNERFWAGFVEAWRDGDQIDSAALRTGSWGKKDVFLRVTARE
ncbi:MAG: hypothetical protein C4576_07150 [Desulfobacteraceae bacterium]|nr:MAG: hypothetical protein C4576_07150 [Desulfobacteraceae bacterium]